jgi:hypothetical protein
MHQMMHDEATQHPRGPAIPHPCIKRWFSARLGMAAVTIYSRLNGPLAGIQGSRMSALSFRSVVATGIGALLALSVGVAQPVKAAEPVPSRSEILCDHAPKGDVLPVPPLISDWVTIICGPTGQALAPELNRKTIWIAKQGEKLVPFMVFAAPPGWAKPEALSGYDIRFAKLVAAERTGDAREMLLKMWDRAFESSPRPTIDRIIQLDALSVVNGTVYNLFFYIAGEGPRWIIVCKDACKWSVPLEVRGLNDLAKDLKDRGDQAPKPN